MVSFTIEQAEYHRNGVGGAGFYAGIVNCVLEGYGTQRLLVTFFPELDDDGEFVPAGEKPDGSYANGRVAVLSLNLLDECGVRVGNKWRGDNFYEVADAIAAEVNARL